jgi:pyruvate/2-oxoglutarate dehydrogenase complex dihydrolipoamide dehydrogenase (E3) component
MLKRTHNNSIQGYTGMAYDYDVIVIGGGAAGLTASAYGGQMGKRVALIEQEHTGGDCTWTGCVPSKALLKIARVAHTLRTAGRYGLRPAAPVVDMTCVRDHIAGIIDGIYQHETPAAFARQHGMEVIIGAAQFLDAHNVAVDGRRLSAKKFVIASGALPAVPPVPGLAQVPYLTHRTLFQLDALPARLLIMGAGPVGVEMAQAFARLGSAVTLIAPDFLPREEPETVALLRQVLAAEGVHLIEATVTAAAPAGPGVTLTLDSGPAAHGDALLVAVGRTPNLAGLRLERAGVHSTPAGIPVNAWLQTNQPHIYAAGDCTVGPKFTHLAGFQGAVAGQNVLLPLFKARNVPEVFIPRVTFTAPEAGHVGLTEAQARAQYGRRVKTFTLPLTEGDRSAAEAETTGFVKLIYRDRGTLLGAAVVADRAGEMIALYAAVIQRKLRPADLTALMIPYPTYADVAKKALSGLQIHELLTGWRGRWLRALVSRLP